jgi:lipopolysaccharide biosynthesis glycosyltransferase
VNIAFTICSNNYLAQAKVLAETFLRYNEGTKFMIVLCDRFSNQIDYSQFVNVEFVTVEELNIPSFDVLIQKYDIVELNTAIKATSFKYLSRNYPNTTKVVYLDPDIEVFNGFDNLYEELSSNDIVLTPHLLKPTPLDDLSPSENIYLNYGLYNLGFLGLNIKSENTIAFLDWWEERLLERGYNDLCNGYFVDQLWVNLAPIFFKKVKILHDKGYNVAPWNLHERSLTFDVSYLITSEPLYFFHFSSFKVNEDNVFSKYYNRVNYENAGEAVIKIYEEYKGKLLRNDIGKFSKIDCVFGKKKIVPKPPSLLKQSLFLFIPPVFLKIYYLIKVRLLKL